VKAGSLEVRDGAFISADTFGAGRGGDLRAEANEILIMGGGEGAGISSGTGSTGSAGQVILKAARLELRDGALIASATAGSGDGGALLVDADTVILSGENGTAGMTTLTGPAGGHAGDITVNASSLEVREGAIISANTLGSGKGGDVSINASNVILHDGSTISARSTTTGLDIENNSDAGRSGSISITARDNFSLLRGSSVSVETDEANAGSVDLEVGSLVFLSDQSSITTSVAGGTGDGGNITIDPVFVILDGASEIVAKAKEGSGGNINIRIVGGGALFKSPDSVIDASSEFGVDGAVEIQAPDTDISGSLVALPAAFLNAASLLSERCAARRAEEVSSFVVVGRGGVPLSPASASLSSYVDVNLTGQQTDRRSGSHKEGTAKNVHTANQQPVAMLELECVR
jgi:large exoprotein involved in heme utilization and adhesion